MNKQLICILLSLLVLAGCSDKKDSPKDTDIKETEITSIDSDTNNSSSIDDSNYLEDTGNSTNQKNPAKTEEVTIAVIPPIPEEGLPEIPDAEVMYSDEYVVIQKGPDGSSYANGQIADKEEILHIKQQLATIHQSNAVKKEQTATVSPNERDPENTTTITTVSTTTTEPFIDPIITALPGYNDVTLPVITDGTVIIDKDSEYVDLTLGNYKSTGDTDLAITDIQIFNNSKPGIKGVDAFKPGDIMIINLWCNTKAKLDSKIYVVPKGANHKDSYKPIECLSIIDMYKSIDNGEGKMFLEYKLPDILASGVYELRFVCGSEEGYISFYFG